MPRKLRFPFRRQNQTAFTLIELLVSMAVLTLMVLMVSQMVGGASSMATLQRQQLDANRQAHLVFDRMAADFSGMVRRPDVDCTAYKYPNYRTGSTAHFKRAGNDSILFFADADSQSTGSTQTSEDSISLVGYRVFDHGGNSTDEDASFRLERLGKSFSWSDNAQSGAAGFGLPFLTFRKPTDPNTTTLSDRFQVVANSTITTYWPFADTYNAVGQTVNGVAESHVLGQDVFRLEFGVLMNDDQGGGSYYLKSDGSNVAYLDYMVARNRSLSGVNAIVVTIAMLDGTSRQRLGSTSDARYTALSAVAAKLVDGDTADVATSWNNTLLNQNGDPAIPRVFTTSAHVYQRFFYLR